MATLSARDPAPFVLQLDGLHGAIAELRVASAAFARPRCDEQLEFFEVNDLDAVLVAPLADAVRALATPMARESETAQARHWPTFALDLPGLVLGSARLTPPDAAGRATLAFRHMIGAPQAAFRALSEMRSPTLTHRETLALRTLEDVALPLLNIAEGLRAWPGMLDGTSSEGLRGCVDAVQAKAADLEFYAGLLRRYVDECAPERVERLDTFDAEDPAARPPAPPDEMSRRI